MVEARRSPESGLGIEEGRMMRQTTYRRYLSKLSVKSVVPWLERFGDERIIY